MVLDPIPQSLPVHLFGSRPQPPTSRDIRIPIDVDLLPLLCRLMHRTRKLPVDRYTDITRDVTYILCAKIHIKISLLCRLMHRKQSLCTANKAYAPQTKLMHRKQSLCTAPSKDIRISHGISHGMSHTSYGLLPPLPSDTPQTKLMHRKQSSESIPIRTWGGLG